MTTLIPTTQAGELALHFYPDAASRNRVTDGVRDWQPPNGTRLVAARHSSLGGARNRGEVQQLRSAQGSAIDDDGVPVSLSRRRFNHIPDRGDKPVEFVLGVEVVRRRAHDLGQPFGVHVERRPH